MSELLPNELAAEVDRLRAAGPAEASVLLHAMAERALEAWSFLDPVDVLNALHPDRDQREHARLLAEYGVESP